MKQDEAEQFAREILGCLGNESFDLYLVAPKIADLCDFVLSLGDMKREIENAAFERAAKVAEDRSQPLPIHTDMERGYAQARKDAAWAIRSLIQPPAQKEDGK